MDIKAFSNVNLLAPQASRPAQTQQSVSNPLENKSKENNFRTIAVKTAPYVAGAVLLAGLGIYAFKSKGKVKAKDVEELKNKGENLVNDFKKGVETSVEKIETAIEKAEKSTETVVEKVETTIEKAEEKAEKTIKETAEKVTEKIAPKAETVAETAEKTAEKVQAPTVEPAVKTVEKAEEKIVQKAETKEQKAAGTAEKTVEKIQTPAVETTEKTVEKSQAPAVETAETAPQEAVKPPKKKTIKQQLTEFTQKVIEETDLHDPKIIEKIEKNRKNEQGEINRIVNKNYHNGAMDMHGMGKAAKGYIADVAGRGEDRYHKAADLLEQALIKDNIVGTKRQKDGLDQYLAAAAKTPIYNVYAEMPFQEAASRLKYLEEHDLASDCYAHGIDLCDWFQLSMEILVKKFKMFNPQK